MRLLGTIISHGYQTEAKVFANLLSHRDDRYEATVIYQSGRASDQGVDAFKQHANVDIERIDTGWRSNSRGDRTRLARIGSAAQIYASTPRLILRARRHNPSLLYSSQQKYDSLMSEAIATTLRRPQIIHLHYNPGPWLGRVFGRLSKVDHIVAVSNFVRDLAISRGVSPERITTVRNAIEVTPLPDPGIRRAIRTELSIPEDAVVISNVGRVVGGKGHVDLVEAFEQLARRSPDLHLVIVGIGDQFEQLRYRVRSCHAAERIHLTGFRSDVNDVLSASDIFAHPSTLDAAPIAVLEACAAGLPVVAYDDGGVRDMVEHEATGMLPATGDVDQLTTAIERLVLAPEARKEMGLAARRRTTSQFNPRDVAAEFADLVERVAHSD